MDSVADEEEREREREEKGTKEERRFMLLWMLVWEEQEVGIYRQRALNCCS